MALKKLVIFCNLCVNHCHQCKVLHTTMTQIFNLSVKSEAFWWHKALQRINLKMIRRNLNLTWRGWRLSWCINLLFVSPNFLAAQSFKGWQGPSNYLYFLCLKRNKRVWLKCGKACWRWWWWWSKCWRTWWWWWWLKYGRTWWWW